MLDHLRKLDEQRIPGGCEDCHAYQTLEARNAPVYRVTVHHDATCPTYRQLTRRHSEGRP